jgi:MFS family permease
VFMKKIIFKKKKMPSNLFYFAIFCDLFSIALIIPFVVDFLTRVGFSIVDVGFVQSIYGTMQVISLPVAGFVMEKYGKRTMMMISIVGTCFSLCLNYASLILNSGKLFLLYRFVVGGCRQTVSTASAIAFDEAGEDGTARTKSISTIQSVMSSAFVVAPVVGGVLMDQFGLDALAIASIAASGLSIVSMWIATSSNNNNNNNHYHQIKKKEEASSPTSSAFQRLLHAAKTVLFHSGMEPRLLILAMFLNSASYIMLQSINSSFMKSKFSLSSSQVGLCISVMSGLSAVAQFAGVRSVLKITSSPFAPRIFNTPRKILLFATWIATLLGLFLIATATTFEIYIGGLVIFSMFAAIVDSFSKAALSLQLHKSTSLAVTLLSSVDGANRMLMPLVNSALLNNAICPPLTFCALLGMTASLCHTFGSTAATIQKNKIIKDDDESGEEKEKKKN